MDLEAGQIRLLYDLHPMSSQFQPGPAHCAPGSGWFNCDGSMWWWWWSRSFSVCVSWSFLYGERNATQTQPTMGSVCLGGGKVPNIPKDTFPRFAVYKLQQALRCMYLGLQACPFQHKDHPLAIGSGGGILTSPPPAKLPCRLEIHRQCYRGADH